MKGALLHQPRSHAARNLDHPSETNEIINWDLSLSDGSAAWRQKSRELPSIRSARLSMYLAALCIWSKPFWCNYQLPPTEQAYNCLIN